MAWMIGIDEAGYGPNLGPLAVAASAWWVEEEKAEGGRRKAETAKSSVSVLAAVGRPRSSTVCLYKRLAKIVCRAASERKLAIADSKQLYKPGQGLAQLERGVLVALRAIGEPSASAPGAVSEGTGSEGTSPPARWRELIHRHAPPLACYSEYDCELPIDATGSEIQRLSTRFDAACAHAGVRLVDLRVRLVYPQEFNELTTRLGNKASALSHVSIGLLRDVIDSLAENSRRLRSGLAGRAVSRPTLRVGARARSNPIRITCDKHGGRNRYAAILQHHFPEHWIDTLAESGPASRYAWGPSETRTEICFRVGGEAELPVALASMTAKYHRELAMRAFNDFWCSRIAELRPTAGYPMDARRYKLAISALQKKIGIDDDCLWRWR
jgi:ribonuclease HII